MEDRIMTCPYCGGAVPSDVTVCPDCQEDLASLVRLEQGHVIYYNEALALAREGRLGPAEDKLRLCLELREAFAPAQILLAKVYAAQERWAEAQAHAQRASDLLPGDARVHQIGETINDLARQDELERATRAQESAQSRRANVESYWATYQRDMTWAFGLGIGLTAVVTLIASGFKSKKRG